MAFPTSPTDGQTYSNALGTEYLYVAADNKWVIKTQDIGVTGLQGATGLIGLIGNTGAQGFTGAQGITGLRGITGLAGAQGATGIRGVTGAQGNDGIKAWNYLFCAALESDVSNVTGDDTLYTIICDNIYTGNNDNYNPSTGIFTAPVDGCYQFIGAITYSGYNGTGVVGEIVTSGHIFINNHYNVSGAGLQLTIPISCMAWLNAGQTAYMAIKAWGGTKTTDVIGYVNGGYPQTHYTYFSGYCVFEEP